MKYKLNFRKKLDDMDALLMRLTYQMGRAPLDQQEETMQMIKEKLEEAKSLVESED